MKECFQVLLEVLIALSEDENSDVAREASNSLTKIQIKCLKDQSMKPTVEILEENLYNLLTKLPRIIRTTGTEYLHTLHFTFVNHFFYTGGSLQFVWLSRLAGYLKVLGKQRLSLILLSTAHLRKLLLTLVYISELDCSHISLLEDTTVTSK